MKYSGIFLSMIQLSPIADKIELKRGEESTLGLNLLVSISTQGIRIDIFADRGTCVAYAGPDSPIFPEARELVVFLQVESGYLDEITSVPENEDSYLRSAEELAWALRNIDWLVDRFT